MNKAHQILLSKTDHPTTRNFFLWQVTLLVISLCLAPLGQSATFPPPTPLTGVSQLWNGGMSQHSCTLMTSNGLKCWGLNDYGQLGDGTTSARLTPVNVMGFEASGASAIALGEDHSCALTTNGGVKCWGYNFYGQLGDNSTNPSPIPVDVTGLTSDVAAIALGWLHSCALTLSGGVKCWGSNDSGQLGDNSINPSPIPVDVTGLNSDVAAIALGWGHSCALTLSGGVKCWGDNRDGQLGDKGISNPNSSIPVDVTGLTSGVVAIALGINHSCALISGRVKCWGDNFYGQLGDNSTRSSVIPVDVAGLTSSVAAIALGWFHSCALTTRGGVKCWGMNANGQLGDNSNTDRWTPIDVTGLTSGVVAIASGVAHSCALTTSSEVKCWGNNVSGQLGDSTTITRFTPINVIVLPNIDVLGNNTLIPPGHTTPNTLDHTDFGAVKIRTQAIQTFVIHNKGGGILHLLGSNSNITCPSDITPSISLGDVSIDSLTPYPLTIGLTPQSVTPGTCTVMLIHNDPNKNPYTFTLAVQGLEKYPLTANVPTLTRPYGTPNPALLPTYNGWLNGIEEPIDIPPILTPEATKTSPPGDYPITCNGGQDDNYLIVCGPPGTLTITPATTTTTLTPPTPNPSLSGNEITFNFAVRPINSTPSIPTGEVKILQSTTPICQAPLTNGLGTCTVPLNGIGPQILTATYLGDSTFQRSTSEAISHLLIQTGYISTPAPGEILNFGSTSLNTPLTAFLKIKETGTQILQVTLQGLTGDPDFKILTPFPMNIANGDPESSIILTCTPTAPGTHMATLELSTNDPAQPMVSYLLTCEGQTTPGYESSPPINSILEIGNSQVGQSIIFPFNVKEVGTGDLQVNFVDLSGPHASDFKVLSPSFPFTIKDEFGEVGTTQTIEIRCTPSDLDQREARLTLTSNDPQHPTITYPIECQGTAIPTAGYASLPDHLNPLNFGSSPLGQAITFKLDLMETGNFPLTVAVKDISGPQAQDFSILSPPFPLTLPDGASPQAVILRCVPSAAGLRMAELAFTSNDPQHPLITYTLQCIGQEEVAYHSEPPPNSTINFGSLPLGKAQIISLSVNKISKGTLDIVKAELTESSYFSLLNWKLPISLQDTAQSLSLQCLPQGSGKHQAALVVTLSDFSKISYSLLCYGLSENTEITKISLSNQIIAAYTQPEEVIGNFHSEATGIADPHFLYRLIEDAQGTFKVFEDQLILAKPLALKQAAIYQIIVNNVEENSGAEKNASFVIKVNAENHAPTEIQLSHAVVGERSQGLVGKLTTLDPDVADTHTYSLSSGGQFVLENGDEVHVAPGIVFKKQSNYLIRVTSTDTGDLSITQEFPIEIQLEARFSGEIRDEAGEIRNNGKIDEPERVILIGRIQPSAFHVGQLADLMFFYHWTPADGGRALEGSGVFAPQTRLEENMAEMKFFQGKLLGLAGVFKIELGYRIGEEVWSEPVFALEVLPNRPPTKLELEMKPILEKSPENTLIGTLSMEDPDQNEHFHYKLVDENKWRGYLSIKENQLLTGPWSLQWGQSYAVRIRGMDLSGASLERTVELEVLKDDSIGELRLTHAQVVEGSAAETPIGRLFILGEKEGNKYRLLEDAQGRFALRGDILVVKAGEKLDFEVQSHYEIVVEVRRGSQRREKMFSIEVLRDRRLNGD